MTTERTGSQQVAISEEAFALFTVILFHDLLCQEFSFMEFEEYVLGYFGMDLSAGAADDCKVNVKPSINIRVDCEVLLAYILRCDSIFECFGFSGCSVLISPADVDGIVATQASKARIHIGGEHTAYQVAQMRNCITVRESRGD